MSAPNVVAVYRYISTMHTALEIAASEEQKKISFQTIGPAPEWDTCCTLYHLDTLLYTLWCTAQSIACH